MGDDCESLVDADTEDEVGVGVLEVAEGKAVEERCVPNDLDNSDSDVAKAAEDRRKHKKRSFAWS